MKQVFAAIFLSKKGEISSLNGLRALAIIFVMLGHLIGGARAISFAMNTNPVFDFLLGNLDSGVDLFFILSGFLIASGLMVSFGNKEPGILKKFYIKRSFRIFPAYYFLLLIASWIILSTFQKLNADTNANPESLSAYALLKGRLVLDFLYLSNIWQGALPHTWSLSTEEHFYLFYPLAAIALIFPAAKSRRFLFYVSFFFAITFLRTIGIFLSSSEEYFSGLAYVAHNLRFDTLCLGVMLADLYVHEKEATSEFVQKYQVWIVLFAFIALLVGHLGSYPDWMIIGRSYRYSFFAIGYAGIALAVLFGKTGLLVRFLSLRIWTPIARLSYGMYLWHFLTSGIFKSMAFLIKNKTFTYSNLSILFIVWLLFTLLISCVLFALIEYPFHKLRDRILLKLR